jgi:PAS domain S-box-containing protein
MRDTDGEAGAALAASEERYRLISEVISDYTFSSKLDGEGKLFLNWVAGAFEKITGYTYEEYVARGGWLATLHPDDVEQDARDMESLRANRPVVTEVRTIAKNGAVRWVRVYGHPVWDPARNMLVGIYGAVQDVTERKQAEAEREALIRELEAKNAELERFTYTVSHDLKSPLITIRGFLTFVERDAIQGNVDRLKADIARIADAVAKMQRLLNELLELSRIGRVVNPPQAVPFGSLAREARDLVAGRIAERRVEVRIEDGLPPVWGDRDRLREVLQNLLDNAVNFMGDQAHPRVDVGMRRDAGEPVFFVRDNGVGIDPVFRDKVFGLFEKLDPDSEGTGVGLALVRRIVALHGGRVWVESGEGGRGATFCFTLAEPPEAGSTPEGGG